MRRAILLRFVIVPVLLIGRIGPVVAQDVADPDDPDQRTATEVLAQLEARSGAILSSEVVVHTLTVRASPQIRALADEIIASGRVGAALPAVLDLNGELAWSDRPDFTHCLVFLSPTLPTTDPTRRYAIAHEVFHCFEFQKFGPDSRSRLPGWIFEGLPEWASMDLVGGSDYSPQRWLPYLGERTALWERAYDAFPFFAHLNRSGELWHHWSALLVEGSADAVAVVRARFADSYSRWAPSLVREPAWGEAWEVDGPDVPPSSVASYPLDLLFASAEPQERALPPVTPTIVDLLLPVDQATRIEVSLASGGVRETGNERGYERIFHDRFAQSFCVGDCICRDDGSGDDMIVFDRSVTLKVAVAAFAEPGRLVVKPVETRCCNPQRAVSSELVGTWEADPDSLLEQVFPSHGARGAVSGRLVLTIAPDGRMTKRYGSVSVTDPQPDFTRYDTTTGVVTGCMTTENLGREDVRYFTVESIESSVSRRFSIMKGQDEQSAEEHQGLTWGVPGETDALGILTILGPDRFQHKATVFRRVSDR